MEIIKITDYKNRKAVSAKELYEKLGYDKSQWARWYKRNITTNRFAIKNEDYVQLDTMSSKTTDFALTIDFAKKLAMLSRTEVGEKIRDYFIEVEKKYVEKRQPTTLDILEMSISQLREQDNKIKQLQQDFTRLDNAVRSRETRPDYYTIVGYANMVNYDVNLKAASRLGAIAAAMCKKRGIVLDTTPDPRFGRVRLYPKKILDVVFKNEMELWRQNHT